MKCPNHSREDVTGYCNVCGTLGCAQCLKMHEGKLLCNKHYRPIAQQIEAGKKRILERKRHPRQRLVVRYKDGRILQGVCFALNAEDPGFHLDIVDDKGATSEETVDVQFEDLKAVFYVKSFDGKFDKHAKFREWTPEGSKIIVQFYDGEVIQGYTLRKNEHTKGRFHLIPEDMAANNISILVESSAVEASYTPEEYKEKIAREREERKQKVGKDSVDLSQEETMGDFYFETRNYTAALDEYRKAIKKYPQSHRIRKKALLATYNVGVQHIKRHEYNEAMECMQTVLATDPNNIHAKKKALQLRRIIQKAKHTEKKNAELQKGLGSIRHEEF